MSYQKTNIGDTGQQLVDNLHNNFPELYQAKLPPGGDVGQILAKTSGADYDIEWVDAPEGGGIPDAPIDNTLYGRRNGTWETVEAVLEFNFRGEFQLGQMYNKNDVVSVTTADGVTEYISNTDGNVLPPPAVTWDEFFRVRNGMSAYELAVEKGFEGTVAEWLVSLRGEKGEPGDAPYISPDTGTWWVGDTDTGVQAQGEPGKDGIDGGVWGGITGDIENQPDLMTLLEGKADKNLPWCAGYFQARSIAANVHTAITPIVSLGESTMVNGDQFLIESTGFYSLYTTMVSSAGSHAINKSALIANSNNDLLAFNALPTNISSSLGRNSLVARLEKGERLTYKVNASSALTLDTATVLQFYFVQLTKEI